MSFQDVLEDISKQPFDEIWAAKRRVDAQERREAKRRADQGWARASLAPIQEGKMKITEATRAAMKERHENGESINAIAKDLGVSWDTVRGAVKPKQAEPNQAEPAAWNAHMCAGMPGDWQVRYQDKPMMVGSGCAVQIQACPWCGVNLCALTGSEKSAEEGAK